nr:hypothetical protein [Erythrobacter aureus]
MAQGKCRGKVGACRPADHDRVLHSQLVEQHRKGIGLKLWRDGIGRAPQIAEPRRCDDPKTALVKIAGEKQPLIEPATRSVNHQERAARSLLGILETTLRGIDNPAAAGQPLFGSGQIQVITHTDRHRDEEDSDERDDPYQPQGPSTPHPIASLRNRHATRL